MKLDIDLNLMSKLVMMFVIAIVIGFLFYFMFAYNDKSASEQTGKLKSIIQKALMQCYALEGSYPSDVNYLTKYGVVFNDSKYIYYYVTSDMSNIMPDVDVLER